MAYGEGTRRALRSAYIYQALSLEAAARKVNVAFGTASRWKRDALAAGDDWDRVRAAARLSGEGAEAVTQAVLEDFVLLFQSTLGEIKNDGKIKAIEKAEAISRLSDAYNKTMSAVAKGSPKLNKLAVAMEVLQLMTKFIKEEHPSLAEGFMEMLEPFGKRLSEALG